MRKQRHFIKNKKMMALLLIACLLVTLIGTNTNAATSGTTGSSVITVKTKANWLIPGGESVTLANSKVDVSYTSWGKTKIKKIYPTYRVQVKANDNSHSFTKVMSGSSVKLSLKRNKSYRITVSYDSNGTWLKYCNLKNARLKGVPSWYVKSTYKVSSCK